jgi:hypothetical protein
VPAPAKPAPEVPQKEIPPGRISLTGGLQKAAKVAAATPVPAWVPLYPGSERPARVSTVGGKLAFEQQSRALPEDVLLHYDRTLKAAGFAVEIDSQSEDPRAPGVLTARKAQPQQSLRITVTPGTGEDAESRILFLAEPVAAR